MLNPNALRTAKTLGSFGRSECNRVEIFTTNVEYIDYSTYPKK